MKALFRAVEWLFAHAERRPWSAIYRGGIGAVLIPVASRWRTGKDPWSLIAVFLMVLITLRLVPLILRRLLPFSREVASEWARQRRLAKRFDSYQWQKLLWIGVGLTSYIVLAADYGSSSVALAAFCLLSGGFGSAMWRRVRRSDSDRNPSEADVTVVEGPINPTIVGSAGLFRGEHDR